MDADILQAIQIIDAKIASLQEARNRLASAFGIVDVPANSPAKIAGDLHQTAVNNHIETFVSTSAEADGIGRIFRGRSVPQQNGRKVQLAQFLSERGPMSRTKIVEACGIPEGTVSYCLNDKRFFVQNANGDWDITEFSRKGLAQRAKTGTFEVEQ